MYMTFQGKETQLIQIRVDGEKVVFRLVCCGLVGLRRGVGMPGAGCILSTNVMYSTANDRSATYVNLLGATILVIVRRSILSGDLASNCSCLHREPALHVDVVYAALYPAQLLRMTSGQFCRAKGP